MGENLTVRRAAGADWPELWPMWRAVVEPGDTYPYDPATPRDDARALWLPGSPAETWLAANATGAVVGSYLLRPNQHTLGDHVANAGFMVAPSARGRGVGRQLGLHCLDRARTAGYRAMQFNAVVATNVASLMLWRSLGFVVVGTVPQAFRHSVHGEVDIHVMHRFL